MEGVLYLHTRQKTFLWCDSWERCHLEVIEGDVLHDISQHFAVQFNNLHSVIMFLLFFDTDPARKCTSAAVSHHHLSA